VNVCVCICEAQISRQDSITTELQLLLHQCLMYIVSVVSQSYEVGVLVSSGTQPARRMHSVSRVADHNHLFHRPAVLRDLFTLADPHLLTKKVH